MLKPAVWILWPSFLAGCFGEMLFFAMFNPDDLFMSWRISPPSRIAVYALGFFFFWGLAAISSGITWLLARSEAEAKR